jgi:uncharacterized protein YecT (DUF1311 family)
MLVLTCGFLPSRGDSQDSAPAPQAAPAAPPDSAQGPNAPQLAPAIFQGTIPADQIAFLKDYNGKMPKQILKDKRFRDMEKEITPPARFFYHFDRALSEARDEALDDKPFPISVRNDRYVMVSSAGGGDPQAYGRGYGRGFLWFDMQMGIGLGGIYFHPNNGEPAPTLTIYSKQLSGTDLSMGQLPPEFEEDLRQWATRAGLEAISPRYFIPDNKKKYVLIHDEDYCAYPGNAPVLGGCQELNVEAADADLNAAYFMHLTGNASDANAYMLSSEQAAWLALRERTCLGPNGAACRIQMARQRTAVLMGHPMPPLRPVRPVRR